MSEFIMGSKITRGSNRAWFSTWSCLYYLFFLWLVALSIQIFILLSHLAQLCPDTTLRLPWYFMNT